MKTPTEKIAANLRAFQIALNSHDRENPTHTAHGIGMAHFDMQRLGFDEGEEVLPGITIHGDDGVTGNFRILCDGDHLEQLAARRRKPSTRSRRSPRPSRSGRRARTRAPSSALTSAGAQAASSSTSIPSPAKQTRPAIFIASARGSS